MHHGIGHIMATWGWSGPVGGGGLAGGGGHPLPPDQDLHTPEQDLHLPLQPVNVRAVRILLECILVHCTCL